MRHPPAVRHGSRRGHVPHGDRPDVGEPDPGAVDFESVVTTPPPASGMPTPTGDDLYILYTGGTTGMPKGVMWRQEDVFMALGQGINSSTGHQVSHDRELLLGFCRTLGL